MTTTVTHTAMGYRATWETVVVPGYDVPQRVLLVHDVEIFCACTRGDFVVDERWIVKAVERAKRKQREAYLPPLHIRHHEPATEQNDSVHSAGFFRITGTRPITLDGKRRLAVFADLIVVDEWSQQQVLTMRYPYRSVELFDPDNRPPSIDGLALLDHEAPYLELPMLLVKGVEDGGEGNGTPGFASVGPPTFRRAETVVLGPHGDPVVACFRSGPHRSFLFRQEPIMADNDPATNEPTQSVLFTEDEKPADKKDGDKENMEEDGGGGLDVSSVVKAIESGEISVADMDAILAAIQAQGSAAEPEPKVEAPAPAAAPGAEAMKKNSGAMTAQMAAMQGKIDGLEARGVARDEADVLKEDVTAGMTLLADRPMGDLDKLEAKLVKFHKARGHGELWTAYLDSLAQTVPLPDGDTTEARFQSQDKQTPDVALKYLDGGGTDAVDRATNFARQHKALQGRGSKITLERYVEINMNTTEEIEA